MSEEKPSTTHVQLVHRSGEQLERSRPALVFNDEQRAMIRQTFAAGASDNEFYVLLAICQAKRLNPFLGQVHFVKRWTHDRGEVWALQTGIDGFRSIAEDTELYDGQDETEFGYDEKGALVWAKARVFRKDISRPFVGFAHFAEYVQKKKDGSHTKMWAEKPHIMLAKCAEALAFRKAFPQPLGELYTSDELGNEAGREDARTLAKDGGQRLPQGAPDAASVDWAKLLHEARPHGGKALNDVAGRIAKELPPGPQRTALNALYKKLKDEWRAEQKAPEPKDAPPVGDAPKDEPKTAPDACEVCGLVGDHAKECPDREDAAQEPAKDGAGE